MKRFAWFPVLLTLFGLVGAACSSSSPSNPLGSTSGVGGADPSGGGVGPVTGVGSSSTASTTTGSSSTGGGCKPGGAGCQGFSECCSGSCAEQVCAACGGEGQSCSEGCCQGLFCYNDKCGSCAVDDAPCALASECCSNVCTQGSCAHCNSLGEFCQGASNCCGGLSCGVDNVCCAKAGGACAADFQCCDGGSCTNGVCGASTSSSASSTSGGNTDALGFACGFDADCGSGLKCLKSTANNPALGGGPANGYCSKDCTSDNDCPLNSVCTIGSSSSVGVCLLLCDIGPSLSSLDEPLDPSKCNGREDLRCGPVNSTGTISGCLPTCGSNDQCPAGRVCDPRTTVCVIGSSVGLPMGAKCNATAPTPECAGVCVSFSGGITSCSSPCSLGGFIDVNDPSANFDCGGLDKGICAFSAAGSGAGDAGFCAEACQTHGDCQNPTFWCADIGVPGSGYCFGATPCPNGQSSCQAPDTCTNTKYGPFCLDNQFPLGAAAP